MDTHNLAPSDRPVRAHNPLGVVLVIGVLALAWTVVAGVAVAMIAGIL